MSVVISTAYMDEAQQWDWIVAMDAGQGAGDGNARRADGANGHAGPGEVLHRAAAGREAQRATRSSTIPPRVPDKSEIAIEAKGLTRRFGDFTAVDHVTPVDRARRDLRLPRLQRLRQVHDDEDADRAAASHRRDRDALRQLGRSRKHGGAQEPRLHDAGVLALRRADRPPEPGPARAPLSHPAGQGEERASRSWSSDSDWARISMRWPRICRWVCASGSRWRSPFCTSRRS